MLLVGLLLATLVVAFLFEISGRRRATAVAVAAQLEERNLMLDLAVAEQERTDARFAAMVRSSSDLTTVVGADGTILYQSPSSLRLLGRTPQSLWRPTSPASSTLAIAWRGNAGLAYVNQEVGAARSFEFRLDTADGGHVVVEARITNLLDDPAVSGVVLNSRDVSERHRLEEELRHQAFHDTLTGLANRALFRDRPEQALARLERTAGVIGVLFIDLDEFKAVNDGRGHVTGDELLQAVAQRLRDMVRVGETMARLGGDEFGMLIEGSDPTYPLSVAERIRDTLQLPFLVRGAETYVHASIGVATTSNSLDSAGELLRHADVAMYAAKSTGKNRCQVFHPGLQDQVIGRLQLGVELARTVERTELVVHVPADRRSDTGGSWRRGSHALGPPPTGAPSARRFHPGG